MSEKTQRKLAAIVSADVVGYSRLMGADETGTLSALNAHRSELIDPLIEQHGGRIVKTTGDGLLLEFPSVVAAVECSIAVQDGMTTRNATLSDDIAMRFRCGIHLGDIIVEGDDIFGDGVNVAARLEALSEANGLALSDDAYRQVRDRIDVDWQNSGEHEVKNIARPIQVWRWAPNGEQRATPSALKPTLPIARPSLAVYSIDNLSPNPDLDHFCAAIAESLVAELSKSKLLSVVSRSASRAIAGQTFNPTRAARDLGVRYLVDGNVQVMGQRMRASINLIDGRNGEHLWTERYNFTDDDLFEAQDRLVADAVVEIDAAISLGDMARTRRKMLGTPEAYAIYQRAYALTSVGTPDDILRARNEWLKLRSAPKGRALGLGGLASCHLMEIRYGWSPDVAGGLAETEALLAEALELEPNFPFLHSMQGSRLLLLGCLEKALDATQRAIALDPTYANSLAYRAFALFAAGDIAGAKRHYESYFHSIPDPSRSNRVFHALFQQAQGNTDLAIEELKEIQTHDPTGYSSVFLAGTLAGTRRLEEANSAMRTALSRNDRLTNKVLERNFTSFRDRKFAGEWMESLSKAGLPEG